MTGYFNRVVSKLLSSLARVFGSRMVPSIDICLKHHTQYTGAAAAMSSPLTALSRNGVFDIVEQAAIRVCRASVFNVEGSVSRLRRRAAVKELSVCEISCELSYPGEHVLARRTRFTFHSCPTVSWVNNGEISTPTLTRAVQVCISESEHMCAANTAATHMTIHENVTY